MSEVHAASRLHEPIDSHAFRNSYLKLTEWMRSRLLNEKNVNDMLAIARFYGEIRWANSDGVYHDDPVEEAVESRVLQSKKLHLPNFSKTDGETVLVASALYDSGGHSRVVLHWLKAFAETNNHRLLITRSAASRFMQSVEALNVPHHLCANSGIELINEILHYCADAERVVLHIHPDDIAAAIASRILAKFRKQIIFFNHADHVFSYGISSAQLVGEVSSYGVALNKRMRRINDYSYLGIPIDYSSSQPCLKAPKTTNPEQTVLSCGAPYKYAPGQSFFGDFIDSVLQVRPNVTFLLVGPTGNEPWWAGTRRRWDARIRFFGELSHAKYLEIMLTADIYVDSFPITGGTAFPEALLNGKVVAGLNNPIQGYSPVDELRSEDVSALTIQVINLLDGNSASICKVVETRNKAEAVHSIKAFRKRIEGAYAGLCEKNMEGNVSVDTSWIEKTWENTCNYIATHDTPHWFDLPVGFSTSYLHKLHSVGNLQNSVFISDAIKQGILALLPPTIRKELIVRRTQQLARVKRNQFV